MKISFSTYEQCDDPIHSTFVGILISLKFEHFENEANSIFITED